MVDCIQKNNYDEAKCQQQINALYECCKAFYKKNGKDASCVSCPKPGLLEFVSLLKLTAISADRHPRLKMKQRAEGK